MVPPHLSLKRTEGGEEEGQIYPLNNSTLMKYINNKANFPNNIPKFPTQSDAYGNNEKIKYSP